MKLPGYYSSGEFARMAQVSVRTIRFYDQKNLLKPSFVKDSGARFYTDSDLAKLQQILLLKYLGFSLDDIREMTIGEADSHFLLHSLKLQKKLVQDRMEQLQLVETAIDNTVAHSSDRNGAKPEKPIPKRRKYRSPDSATPGIFYQFPGMVSLDL